MEPQLFIIFFILIFILVIFSIVYGIIAERKRREALQLLASRLGLNFYPDRNRDFASAYEFLDQLDKGRNRYAYNIFQGNYQGEDVHMFDYHYETESRDSEGKSTTHSHYLSGYLLQLPLSFPELTIASEGFLSKFAQAFGYDDIDFESAEFSRNFCVRSGDKKFAYDVCHAKKMEYLLVNSDLNLEIQADTLALIFDGEMSIPQIEYNLGRLLEIRRMMPEYLFNQH
jgi:hypothetical protein